MNLSNLNTQLARWSDFILNNPDNPKGYVQRGMVNFKLANIEESITDFDTAEQLEPSLTPYLWQRGLSYYYASRFAEGAKQFELDLVVNSQDVEETIWRYLCIARLQGVTEARQSLLRVKNDPRLVMRRVYELYAGNCSITDVLAIENPFDQHAKFYSHLYVGLYFEAANEPEQAQFYITKAANKYQIQDYMWYLAGVHKTLRGWS
ncbi:MAG: hypothetical protein QNJ47_06345 [Nostocaceae cyanobacterium]|nr:hypothetical protein [Nostocaceae cyanobacterium]